MFSNDIISFILFWYCYQKIQVAFKSFWISNEVIPEDALQNNLEGWSGVKIIQINIRKGSKILLAPLYHILAYNMWKDLEI